MKSKDESSARKEPCNPKPPLNKYQLMHIAGTFDVNAPIPQEDGEDLPCLSTQWKMDYARRYNGNSTSRG